MLGGVVVFLLIGASVVLSHKLGHYAVGRHVVGIAAPNIRVVIVGLPQYVALRDGQQWVSPLGFEAYLEAYREYDPDESYLLAFLAGGVLAQTASVLVIAGVAFVVGVSFVGQSAVLASGMLASYQLFSDLGARLHVGTPCGDFSALFEQSPATTVALLCGFVGSHGLLYSLF